MSERPLTEQENAVVLGKKITKLVDGAGLLKAADDNHDSSIKFSHNERSNMSITSRSDMERSSIRKRKAEVDNTEIVARFY